MLLPLRQPAEGLKHGTIGRTLEYRPILFDLIQIVEDLKLDIGPDP
jgi:hypothetical protein